MKSPLDRNVQQQRISRVSLLLLLPALFFYAILWRNATSLPVGADDYHAILEFTNTWVTVHGFPARLLHILTFQQNEYKLLLESVVVALQFSLLGHISFPVLILLGNLFVLAIFAVLLSMVRFVRQAQPLSQADKLLVLAPVSLLLFQLQYATTLDWAMAGLQNITVLFFSLAAINLLGKNPDRLAPACLCMLLAIASSGNGFIAGAVGVLMLFQKRRWRHLMLWVASIALLSCVYFLRYNFHSSQSVPGATVAQSLTHFNPLYGLSFLGSSIARYQSYTPSLVLGLVLLLVFVHSTVRRYDRTNPAVFYSMVFLLLTALGVCGLRSNLGIAQSLASRYRIYSNLMLIFAYVYLVETNVVRRPPRLSARARRLLGCVSLACLGFCAVSDVAGGRFLAGRKNAIAQEMRVWQNSTSSTAHVQADNADNAALRRQLELGIYRPDTDILLQSIRLGVYRLPTPSACPGQPRCQ